MSTVAPAETVAGATRKDPRTVLRQCAMICRRNLMQLRSDPLQLFSATFMPILITIIFINIFGGAIGGGSENYTQYLLPGITVQTVTVASRLTGVGLNLDFTTGMMDRFRSFPIARSSVLIGRIAADLCRMVLAQIVMLAFAFLIGFRIYGGPLATLAAMVLMLGFGAALCWVSAWIGLVVRGAESVQMIGSTWIIPLQFGSSMFVSPSTMPGWLRTVVEVNPMTLVCDACRDLLLGANAIAPVLGSLAWIVGLTAVFGPLAVLRYSRRF
jgi:oleandomycin transport system permease protein